MSNTEKERERKAESCVLSECDHFTNDGYPVRNRGPTGRGVSTAGHLSRSHAPIVFTQSNPPPLPCLLQF